MRRTHGALALILFFGALLGSCEITGRTVGMLPLIEPPPPCGPVCPTCMRECAPLPAKEFIGPYLVWYGEDPNDAVCPLHAPTIIFRGHAGLLEWPWDRCVACVCTPGRCVLPEGISASATEDCEVLEHQPLDAQDIWAESIGSDVCTSPEKVAPALSRHPTAIFVPPPRIASCTPAEDKPSPPHIAISPWRYTGVVCSGTPRDDECSDASTTCVAVEDEYSQCILYRGPRPDPECPQSYPEKLVLYRSMENTLDCAPCSCGPPEGGECAVRVSTYWQRDCQTESSFTTVTQEEPGCIESPSRMRIPYLGIKSLKAEWLVNQPASCLVSGGEQTGVYRPEGAQVLCCQTQPIPKKMRPEGDDQDAGSGDP